jgi:hypothetical protein
MLLACHSLFDLLSVKLCMCRAAGTASASAAGVDYIQEADIPCVLVCAACLQVYLWRVCESVLRLTRPMVKDNVRLINCISRDMPPVKGDSTRLMQVRGAALRAQLMVAHMHAFMLAHAIGFAAWPAGMCCLLKQAKQLPAPRHYSMYGLLCWYCATLHCAPAMSSVCFNVASRAVWRAGVAQPSVHMPQVHACW